MAQVSVPSANLDYERGSLSELMSAFHPLWTLAAEVCSPPATVKANTHLS